MEAYHVESVPGEHFVVDLKWGNEEAKVVVDELAAQRRHVWEKKKKERHAGTHHFVISDSAGFLVDYTTVHQSRDCRIWLDEVEGLADVRPALIHLLALAELMEETSDDVIAYELAPTVGQVDPVPRHPSLYRVTGFGLSTDREHFYTLFHAVYRAHKHLLPQHEDAIMFRPGDATAPDELLIGLCPPFPLTLGKPDAMPPGWTTKTKTCGTHVFRV
jgi:hypothetical protein